jgi:hypothetical protein
VTQKLGKKGRFAKVSLKPDVFTGAWGASTGEIILYGTIFLREFISTWRLTNDSGT